MEYNQRDEKCIEITRELYRGGRLLFILAAMRLTNENDRLEALRNLGTRGVDAYNLKGQKRRKRAGEARERPVTDARHYVRGNHLERSQKKIADELYVLMVEPDALEKTLIQHGKVAVSKHF
jgi:hypothetical protein